ncbi:hypothetical protein AS189_14820 [Arthrobacter alpinus]|uniref:Uncharacterized protein n=1 Tax=Arthrobacter alpinus TaxID=656366 RepID=A0A0S2M1Z5_9MICC|nr:hypothetical protein AS189_14820 [Arthrobacter alpinus]
MWRPNKERSKLPWILVLSVLSVAAQIRVAMRLAGHVRPRAAIVTWAVQPVAVVLHESMLTARMGKW